MDPRISQCLSSFDPISLEGLNDKAAMLKRLDNKYIVPAGKLLPVFKQFAGLFDVLEIDQRREFTYATNYFDNEEAQSYYDHHQGRRKRCKVRIRHYLDAGFSYLEVKLKDTRDVTVKKRLTIPALADALCYQGLAFVDDCHGELYGMPLGRQLEPMLGIEYKRITLVAKQGGERMTIDTGLLFRNGNRQRAAAGDIFILEAKSGRGNGVADKVLRGHHLHPTKRCSKYCVGMAALGRVRRHNRFLPALRKLALVGVCSGRGQDRIISLLHETDLPLQDCAWLRHRTFQRQ